MNYRVIALMVVCIALVATAGCLGVPSKILEQSSDRRQLRMSTRGVTRPGSLPMKGCPTGACPGTDTCSRHRFRRGDRDQDHQDRVYHD